MSRYRALLAVLALAAALAGPASAATPSIPTSAATEGTAISVPISHKCGTKQCTYAITTVDGTALAPGDYTTATTTGKAKKGKTFRKTLSIATTPDTVCEAPEKVTVRVTITRKGVATPFDGAATINDDDCAGPLSPAGTAQPAPPNPLPASSPGTVVQTRRTEGGNLNQSCDVSGVGRDLGNGTFQLTCSVYVWCPTSVPSCTVSSGGMIIGGQSSIPEKVDLFAALTLNQKPPQDLDGDACSGVGSCKSGDLETQSLKPGQFQELDCTGSHKVGSPPPGAPQPTIQPARLFCQIEADFS